MCNETVYEDDDIKLNRLWNWKVKSVYEDAETGLMNALVSGNAFNYSGVSAYASRDGKRLTSLDFDYSDNFSVSSSSFVISETIYLGENNAGI